MSVSLKNYLPTLTLTCGYPNRVNLPQEIDENASREIEGVTSVTYEDFPEARYCNIKRPACRAVGNAIVDFKLFTDRALATVFQQRKEVAVAVMKHAPTQTYKFNTDTIEHSGSERYSKYCRHSIPIAQELQADCDGTKKRLFTNLSTLEQKLISDSRETFGIALEQKPASSSSSAGLDVELEEKLVIGAQNTLEPFLTQVYQTAVDVIGVADEKFAKALSGRVLEYCGDVERELIEAKKREWADRFYWIMLQFAPRHGETDTTKREITVWGTSGFNGDLCAEEGEKLLASGEKPDFYLKFGDKEVGVHKKFLEKALLRREWSFERDFITCNITFSEKVEQVLKGVDITCSIPELGQEEKLLAALKEYLYTGKVTCDSDLVPCLFIVSNYLRFENLQKNLAREMFGIERFRLQIEQAIAEMDAVAKEPAQPSPTTLDDLATRVAGVMHDRMQRILSITSPIENLLNLLTPLHSYNDNNNRATHY